MPTISGLEELEQIGPNAATDGLTGTRKFKLPWASPPAAVS